MPNQNVADVSKVNFEDVMNVVDLSFNPITSLVGMPELPNLKTLNLSHTLITSFQGIPRLRSLSVLDIRGTPLAKNQIVRIAALILFPDLNTLNGSKVTVDEKARASEYPAQCAFLIRKGWIPSRVPPTVDSLIQISREMNKLPEVPRKKAPTKKIVSQKEYLTSILREQKDQLSS